MRIVRTGVTRTARQAWRPLPTGLLGLALALTVTTAALGQTAGTSMTVFVAASEAAPGARPTEADRQQASAAIKAAQTARKGLEKTLKAQFGNKRDQWPAEARERYVEAEEAEVRLNTEWLYRSGEWEPLPRNVSDLKDSLQGIGLAKRKENVMVVATREEAQLVVEVSARRTAGMSDDDPMNDQFWVSVLIKRGPRLSEAQFGAVPRTYRFPQVTRLAAPSDAAPWWRFEGAGTFLWSAPAHTLSRLIEDFIAKNRAAMMAEGR